MTIKENRSGQLLLGQLLWFIRLRWIAGATVLSFALADWFWLNWYGRPVQMLITGATILAYNALMLVAATRPAKRLPGTLLTLAWAQILMDVGCLTLLTSWTGGVQSPLLGFYVFHMIFASLLLPRRMAYAGAVISIALAAGGLWLDGHFGRWELPQTRLFAGWVASLLLTVYLANRITRALRRQRHRLLEQNRQIRRIDRKVRRQQEVLVRQEKMAALGHMAAGITHEIANPLASMDTLLQVLQRKPERITPESLQTLRTQVSRINQIVRQMTTFAHPGEGQREQIATNQMVETVLEMLQFDKRLKNVSVQRELSADAGYVTLMPQAMQQVLINIISNALDAMESTEQPRLTLRTLREGSWSVVQVIDNGHGIPQEYMSRIFEPFFTTKPVGKGTGIGLSISYSLVQKQGGELHVKSRSGEGACFTIRLPAAGSVPQIAVS